MGNSNASSAVPLIAAQNPGSPEPEALHAREFHFAVTWVTLFAYLDPIESTGPHVRVEPAAAPTLALVPVVAPPPLMERPPIHDSPAAWEMVVPKMIRTGPRTFLPADDGARKPELL